MKKKIFLISGILIILIVLLVPFKRDTLEDGGTKIYSAPLLKVVQWYHSGLSVDYEDGTWHETEPYYSTSIYFFPRNLKNINDLAKEYWNYED